jgi:LmbE family N-acetylglucosaminyl deacetylase
MNFGEERLLVIAPHPDDEVLGCGGLINKIKSNGGEVYVQVLTMGGYTKSVGGEVTKEIWKKEFLKTTKFLDLDGYDILFEENKLKSLDTVPFVKLFNHIEHNSDLSISKIKPTIVAIPTIFSSNQDHTWSYKASITALRPHPQSLSYLPKLVISYESPEYYFWSSYSEFGKFSPNFYLQMSQKDVNRKIKALNIYKSQILEGQRDGNKVSALSAIRGSEIGVSYSEAYNIHRLQL